MKLPDLFINAVSTFDGKALAKAEKTVGSFAKNVAKSLGLAFGTTAVIAFGKASVKAFADDQAAAVRLTKSVENLGLGFEDTKITRFIADLEKSASVADDVLRPAFQSLISTTGSVTKSQDLLALALEISAGTGIDAAEVAKDLSLAYLGQSKGIAKYNTGLTKSELAASSFLTIQEKLTEQYSGQNAARLDTYAGKVSAVQIAYGNLQETVGGALVDAFARLAGDTTTEDLTESVDNLADSLASVVELVGQLATPFVFLAKLGGDFGMAITKLGYKLSGEAFMGVVNDRQYGGAAAEKYKATEEAANAKARAKAEADAAKRQKELLALQKKSALAEKNKLSLSKAAAVFDSTRISIAAALRATYDKETRLRLEALMAIEDDQGDLALKKINELAALQQNADLARLAGITTISDAALLALNTQLLTELKVINDSKMAEKEKEALRDIAFGKYNAALIASGGLADKNSYNERVQIQLTEIAKLAALSNTTNAGLVLNKIRESAELLTIDTIAAAQKKADDARYAALLKYIELMKTLGLCGTKMPGSQFLPEGITMIGKTPFVTGPIIDPNLRLKTVDITAAITADIPAFVSATEFFSSLSPDQKTDLGGYSPYMNYKSGYPSTYNVVVNAGVVGNEDTLVKAVQDAILAIDRRGDSVATAGSL